MLLRLRKLIMVAYMVASIPASCASQVVARSSSVCETKGEEEENEGKEEGNGTRH